MNRNHLAPVATLIAAALVLPALPCLRAQTSQVHEAAAPLPGVKLWYLDTGGSGVPIVLLHAKTGSSRVWEKQIPVFAAAGYRVISYDRRGYGRTVVDPSGPQPGTAADDLENLMNYLKIDRFHLLGTALGGYSALDYALSHPDRLRSLIIASSIGAIEDPDYVKMGARLRPPEFEAMPPEIREVGPAYRAANAAGTERWVELNRISRPPGPALPEQPLNHHITFALLENIKVPTLFITGGADMFAPPPLLPLFTARVKNSKSLNIPDAGHSAYWENPEAFNKAVLDFIHQH